LKIDNKIEKAFGRTSVFTGIIFFFAGFFLMVAGFNIIGAITFSLAIFVGFTYSGVELDTERRLIRMYSNWFGFIRTGKWRSLKNYIGITLIPIARWESMASWTNRMTASKTTEYRIYLVNDSRKPAIAIKKCKSHETAQNSLDEFSLWLKMPVFTVKI
jgi:hypothetical protein